MSTRVDVLKTDFANIEFPHMCPVCGSDKPDTTINIRTYMPINQPITEKFNKKWYLEVPVCTHHKSRIQMGRLISGLVFLLCLFAAVAVFFIFWQSFDQLHWAIYTAVAIGLITAAIYIHGKVYAAPLLFVSFSHFVSLTFKHKNIAEEFARINGIEHVFNEMNIKQNVAEQNDDA